MPIYEYRCEDCGVITEFLHKRIGLPEKVACERCGSEKVAKLLSAANVSVSEGRRATGKTCCGRDERCNTPPCSSDGSCRR